MKKQNGITLISLIITIIIMLILAGVALSMVMGEGSVIDQATAASENTRGGDVHDYVELVLANNKVAKYSGKNKSTKLQVIEDLYEQGKITEEEKNKIKEEDKIIIGDIEIDFSRIENMTLSEVNNSNIGDYIDLGNNIVGTESTTDDWRILYVDGSTIYVILSDYLQNSTNYAQSASLETDGTYGVFSTTSGDLLVSGLLTESNWSELANEIDGATVTGTPTAELLMNSYNTKNGTNLVYTNHIKLDSTIQDYDLYLPYTEAIEGAYGYWLASQYVGAPDIMWYVNFDGQVSETYAKDKFLAIRPIVALPSSTSVELVDGVWTVSQ